MSQPITPPKPATPAPAVKPAEPKAGTAASTKHDEFLDTDEEGYTLIMGPPENGKTFGALMVSDFFDKERLKLKGGQLDGLKDLVLEDVLHIPLDFGALDGIKAYRMKPHTINLIGMIEKYGVQEAWKPMVEAIATMKARHPALKYIMPDTISALDADITRVHTDIVSPIDRGQANNGLHSKYRTAWNKAATSLGFDAPILLAHVIPKFAGIGEANEAKRMAAQDVAEGDMVPLLTGKAAPTYIGHSSFCLVADVEGTGDARTYWFYGQRQGWSTKNRYRALTGVKWPADLGETYRMIGRKPKKAGSA